MCEQEKQTMPAHANVVEFLPIKNFDVAEVLKNFEEMAKSNKYKNVIKPVIKHDKRSSMPEELFLALTGMGMEKYIEVFEEKKISFKIFLQSSDNDLMKLGVTDPNDREIIKKNLAIYYPTKKSPTTHHKQSEYLRVIRNLSNQLKMTEKYCQYLHIKLRQVILSDFIIEVNESVGTYLKTFTECGKIQSYKLKLTLHYGENVDCLINKTLKINRLVLPSFMEDKLQSERNKIKQNECRLI